jgi:hypothetical protein
MRMRTISSELGDTQAALETLKRQIAESGLRPDFALMFATADHDKEAIAAFLNGKSLVCPVLGGSSSNGFITEQGIIGRNGAGLGLMLFEDPEGSYGVGRASIGDDPAAAARAAFQEATINAGQVGTMPDLLWVYQSPGHEEAVVAELTRLAGPECSILGGSSADNTIGGNWFEIAHSTVAGGSVVVAALYPSGAFGHSFFGGFDPSGKSARVTKADGRVIFELEGRPAADVYNEWADGVFLDARQTGAKIMVQSARFPLGIRVDSDETSVTNFRLIHSASIGPDGSLHSFANAAEGDVLHCMTGSQLRIVRGAGDVAREAKAVLDSMGIDIAGAVIVFCAGVRMALGENTQKALNQIRSELGGAPVIGAFTFGEQGTIRTTNVHGNLMINIALFGTR